MKAAVIEQRGRLVVREVPDPVPDAYQALVKIDACCICNSTDRKLIEGKFPGMTAASYPAVLGHESVGTVVQVGDKVRRLRVRDRVFRPRTQYGPGVLNVCWGGFAEYGLATDADAFAADNGGAGHRDFSASAQQIVPPELEPDEATILITLKETLSWLRKFEVGPNTSVLVFGAGPVGLAFCELAKLIGSTFVAVVGRRDEALACAKEFGADGVINSTNEDVGAKARELTGGKGFDRAIDGIGLSSLLDYAPAVLASGGRFGIYGVEDAEQGQSSGRISVPARGEWSLTQIYAAEHLAQQEITDLVRAGRLRPARYITHRLPLERINEGFELIQSKAAVKVVIEMP